jgi:hypothetical protein
MQGFANSQLVQANQLHFSRHIRVALVLLIADFSALAVSPAARAQTPLPSANVMTILVYNFVGAPPLILAGAERQANRVLATASAQALWIDCLDSHLTTADRALCKVGWTAQTPGLRLIRGVNKSQQTEFAETAIPVLSTIYYERVQRRAELDNAPYELPVLLGCVIAHELGHLLLNNPGHSASGIMQPSWGARQIQEALNDQLQFTRAQSVAIQIQLRPLAQARVDTSPSSESSPHTSQDGSPSP